MPTQTPSEKHAAQVPEGPPVCANSAYPWRVADYGVGRTWAYTLRDPCFPSPNLLISVRKGRRRLGEQPRLWYVSWCEGGGSGTLLEAAPLVLAIETGERHYRTRMTALADGYWKKFQAHQAEAVRLREVHYG